MVNPVTVTRHGKVALVSLNNPPVNALSHGVRNALRATLQELYVGSGVEAIVIACDGRTFVAGADIREFDKPPLAPDVPEIIEFVDSSPLLTIAAIHGTALGGGLELALACHIRVATASAKLGLPEVTLGILPGAGGTQRLPRLIGVRPALELIVSGKLISAQEAQRLGLVDELVGDDLKEAALAFAQRALAEGRAHRRVSALSAKLDDAQFFSEFERSIAQRCRGYLAPFRGVDAVRAAVELPFEQGLQRERELFRELMASPESKAQRHLFFGEREVSKVPGLPEDTPTRPLKSVAVVGAGALASALAKCWVGARLPVTLLADTQDELDRTLAAINGGKPEGALAARELVRSTLSYDDLRTADLVIEAVDENLNTKLAALTRIDGVAKPGAILATSTAFLDLDTLASATQRPADVVGMHFAAPIERLKLLENVRGRHTAPDAYATVMKFGRSAGKVAVPVRGYVASRSLAHCLREALFLLEEGAQPEEVDRALTAFGFPMGPFAALDAAGLETALAERRARFAELSERERGCSVVEELFQLGRLGRASGAGFYRYDGERAVPDPAVAALLEKHSRSRSIERRSIPLQELEERCLYRIINEAARVLEEEVAARPLDIDMIWVHGCGFPAYRGGPLFFADQLGLRHVHEHILRYRERVGEACWTPAPLIERLAAHGGSFYARG